MSADCPRCIGGNLLWNKLTHCLECLQCGYSKEIEVAYVYKAVGQRRNLVAHEIRTSTRR